METITIRQIDQNDLDAVVEIHCSTFSDRALTHLGKEAVRRYYHWQFTGPHDAVAGGIFQGNRMAGFCFGGIFYGSLYGFLRKNKWFLIRHIVAHPWIITTSLIWERIILACTVLLGLPRSSAPEIIMPSKSFGILALAIDPRAQGTGLGSRLMTEIEKIAVERGFAHMHLTVDQKNMPAISFYQKQNWQKLSAVDGQWYGTMIKHLDGFQETGLPEMSATETLPIKGMNQCPHT